MAYRIAALYLLSVLALLALLGTGVYLLTERTLLSALESDLAAQAQRDVTTLQAATLDPTALEGTARALAPALAGGRSSVRIFTANARVLADPDGLGTQVSREVLHELPPNLLTVGLLAADQPGRLYAAAPLPGSTAGTVIAVVEVSQPRDEIDRVLNRLATAFGLAGVVAVGLALAAGALLARSIVAPIRRLERVAAAIAGGDLARRVTGLPPNELGALGASFNQMAARLAGLLAQARAEQERLTAILRGLADGVLACDAAGHIILENPAARDVLGVPVAAPLSALEEACAALGLPALWARARQGTAPVEMEVSPAGRSVLAVAAPVQAGADGPGCVCVLRDITRARETEQGRAAVLRRLGHELRTPLTAVQAVVSNLLDDAPPAQAHDLAVVEEETARLARLVEELLAVARGPTTANLELRPLDLRRLAADACALFATRATRLGIRLVGPDSAPVPVIVRGDPDRLRQVLVNLLDNALRYTPAGGEVAVTVRGAGAEAALAVRDSGPGMDPVTSRWAFEPYYQGPAPVGVPGEPVGGGAPAPRGSGLGLAIVREIVTAHGGRLTLETAKDQGTTVTAWLPLLTPFDEKPSGA